MIAVICRSSRQLVLSHSHRLLSTKLTSSADVVVCGGGIAGTSVAYHLAKRGKKVCIFERDTLYGRFKFTKCGRVYLASSISNEILLRRMYSRGVLYNDDVELIDCQSEMLARWPFLQTEDVQLALYSPEDLAVDPVALCQELARHAREAGAVFFENCEVREVLLGDERQVYAVDTDGGLIETPRFVDASGIWTGTVILKPLPHRHIQTAAYPCTYTYIHSSKLPTGVVSDFTPILLYLSFDYLVVFNDLDGNIMIRATGFKTLCAGFSEESVKPLARQGTAHGVWHHPEPEWDRFGSSLERLLYRCPMIGDIDHGDLICGMESYTPDKAPTIGESSQARGYYVLNGLNGQGLSLAGGLGELLSDWICDGMPQIDVASIDVARFLELHANSQYLMERVPEIADGVIFRKILRCYLWYFFFLTFRYFMVAPTIQQERCMTWMKKWVKKLGYNVHIQASLITALFKDVTGMYTALDVIGPSSRYLMSDITGISLSTTDFPTFRCQEINIGMATGIRAISVTHCGELGWVVYIPNEVAQNVYERIVEAGQEYSMLHAGYYTLRQLRIEKFYVYWGQDINATVTPVECGRSFRVDFKMDDYDALRRAFRVEFKKDFIGRSALEKQLERGISKRFVQLLVDKHDKDTDPWPQGGETLFRDGRPVGVTTSAAYGFTLGCQVCVLNLAQMKSSVKYSFYYFYFHLFQVCIAYVENKEFGVSMDFLNRGSYELDIAGKRFPVRVNLHSPSLPMISSEHPLHYRPTQ
uniref:Pyruvate dehydrogenase phosphatase regulatory subunit, mitochondrial n=1 Tax=Heterorhabditis bacteriophora TaxID=37862 RepID=A0A1I7XPI7_HETBA